MIVHPNLLSIGIWSIMVVGILIMQLIEEAKERERHDAAMREIERREREIFGNYK